MKSFERLELACLKNITNHLLCLPQFAYWASRSVDDAVNFEHFILQHLDRPFSYSKNLLLVPELLHSKLTQINQLIANVLTAGDAGKILIHYLSCKYWLIPTPSPKMCSPNALLTVCKLIVPPQSSLSKSWSLQMTLQSLEMSVFRRSLSALTILNKTLMAWVLQLPGKCNRREL